MSGEDLAALEESRKHLGSILNTWKANGDSAMTPGMQRRAPTKNYTKQIRVSIRTGDAGHFT